MKVYWDSLKQDIQFLLAFLLAIVVFVAMVIFIYPGDEEAVLQISGFSEMGDWEASYGIVFGEDAPYKFWLAFLIFSFIGIFYVALPVLSGTTIVSKDVDNNTIDLLMGNPLSKRRVFIEKLLEVLTISSIPILVLFLSLLAFSWFIGQNIAVTLLFAACIQLLPLTCGIAILSSFFSIFFLSADRARKFMAIIVVGSFLISLIVSYSEELEFLKYFQVFYYYDSPQTLLKPSFDKISWNKSIIMIIFSLVMFCFCFYINEKKDYFPHYSHKIKEKTKKDTGIPLLFFYSRKFQERFPCFVEELQSDKLIIYIFGIVLIISGLITPSMYPGDSAWLSLTKTYNNVLVEALLAGHGVAPNYSGYIATEGFGEFFLYLSIITIVLGPKVIFRDHRSATIDMIFAQPLPFNKVVNQRLAAIILEIFTLGLLSITGYVLGTILLNDYYNYIPAIGAGILFIFLITLTMTFINAFIASFLKNTGSALGASTLVYFGLYLTYLIAFTIDPLKTLSKLTPFSWSDRTGILYDQTLHWNDFLAFFGYVSLIALMTFLTLRNIKKKEFLG